MKPSIENIIIELYSNKTLNKGFRQFFNELKNVPDISFKDAYRLGTEVFTLLSELSIINLNLSFNNSESVFFRFNTSNNYEFKLQIFYDYDNNDETDIESILHVYQNGTKIGAYFGSVEYLFNIINKLSANYYECYEIFKTPLEYLTPSTYGILSPAINTYPATTNNFVS